jgi:hypothetical protein
MPPPKWIAARRIAPLQTGVVQRNRFEFLTYDDARGQSKLFAMRACAEMSQWPMRGLMTVIKEAPVGAAQLNAAAAITVRPSPA